MLRINHLFNEFTTLDDRTTKLSLNSNFDKPSIGRKYSTKQASSYQKVTKLLGQEKLKMYAAPSNNPSTFYRSKVK
jgi:hypothetical protein